MRFNLKMKELEHTQMILINHAMYLDVILIMLSCFGFLYIVLGFVWLGFTFFIGSLGIIYFMFMNKKKFDNLEEVFKKNGKTRGKTKRRRNKRKY